MEKASSSSFIQHNNDKTDNNHIIVSRKNRLLLNQTQSDNKGLQSTSDVVNTFSSNDISSKEDATNEKSTNVLARKSNIEESSPFIDSNGHVDDKHGEYVSDDYRPSLLDHSSCASVPMFTEKIHDNQDGRHNSFSRTIWEHSCHTQKSPSTLIPLAVSVSDVTCLSSSNKYFKSKSHSKMTESSSPLNVKETGQANTSSYRLIECSRYATDLSHNPDLSSLSSNSRNKELSDVHMLTAYTSTESREQPADFPPSVKGDDLIMTGDSSTSNTDNGTLIRTIASSVIRKSRLTKPSSFMISDILGEQRDNEISGGKQYYKEQFVHDFYSVRNLSLAYAKDNCRLPEEILLSIPESGKKTTNDLQEKNHWRPSPIFDEAFFSDVDVDKSKHFKMCSSKNKHRNLSIYTCIYMHIHAYTCIYECALRVLLFFDTIALKYTFFRQ